MLTLIADKQVFPHHFVSDQNYCFERLPFSPSWNDIQDIQI